ncbi:MAG: universal stress protein [Burkholderiales bacterium]
MFKHILAPTDGSKLADKAVRRAIEFAAETKARVTVLHVTPRFPMLLDESYMAVSGMNLQKRFEQDAAARAAKILTGAQKDAKAAKVECEGVTAASDAPYEEIVKQAKKHKCDLIMMASHGRHGIKGLLLGSETAKVLTHSTIPVLVYR